MPTFTFEVIETRQYRVEYTVEADTRDEALLKAAAGETVDEVEGRCTGVTDRYVEA
ncbi:Uncharacterised protein (plasmid) [Tsukamurella tyrosinosolvens]|uniref:Uncharacterized protein n=1 Tax=Tsukamurella tyrosinosolvens TaxID=57704 RepID=A0A1H4V6W0_TSUTY|nr:hypothetical protein [Tsukamurella tyrosinosolvens]SEC76348.1 hypothetical protein SAMN04489793_3151 [Tsukamurella tyrosinosolvens]VEH90668.1 Uncharacterised protein [Tsukamurella tyrosinosolvens]